MSRFHTEVFLTIEQLLITEILHGSLKAYTNEHTNIHLNEFSKRTYKNLGHFLLECSKSPVSSMAKTSKTTRGVANGEKDVRTREKKKNWRSS